MPAAAFDTSGKSAALVQGADGGQYLLVFPKLDLVVASSKSGCCFFVIAASNRAAAGQNVSAGHRPDTEAGDHPRAIAAMTVCYDRSIA